MRPRTLITTSLILGCLLLAGVPVGVAIPSSIRTPDREDELVIFFDQPMTSDDVRESLDTCGLQDATYEMRRQDMAVVQIPARATATSALSTLRRMPAVSSAGPNGTVQALESVPPNDPYYDSVGFPQRDYLGPASEADHSIHAEPVWDAVFNGDSFALTPDRRGVTIAVIDTGVSVSMLEDTDYYASGWDYVANDADTTDDAWLANYHGSRVASLIRSETDNANAVAGILHDLDARLVAYKVLNYRGWGETADTQQAMRDAVDAGAQIVNLSLGEKAVLSGTTTPDTEARQTWQDTVDYCVNAGAIVVAASGNSSNDGTPYDPVWYPAACTGAMAVGSIDVVDGVRSSYSCFGPELDIVAPGRFDGDPDAAVLGLWTVPPDGVPDQVMSGTSFSAPVVAGALGLLWSLVPDLDAATLTDIVLDTADDSYGTGPGFDDATGWGLIDMLAAYGEMTSTIPAQPPISLTTTSTGGLEVSMSWTVASGTGVSYEYGYVGGPGYTTTDTSARLVVPGDGPHTTYVRSSARDMWGAQTSTTTTITLSTGLASITSTRLAGRDRYSTCVDISAAGFPTGADTVVMALGSDWPDALTASTLAYAADGPLLLTKRTSIPIAIRDELLRLTPSQVYVVGGAAAIDESVVDDLMELLPGAAVVRKGGTNRYDTARLVAEVTAGITGPPGTAVLTSGENYPDAISAAPFAARAGYPILLTRAGYLPSQSTQAFSALGITSTIVIGGDRAIGSDVYAALPSPERWGGSTRYHTSRIIAENGYSLGVYDSRALGFATGRGFADALSAGPLTASQSAPVLLADSADASLVAWLAPRGSAVDTIGVYGGRTVMSYDLEFDIMNALRTP